MAIESVMDLVREKLSEDPEAELKDLYAAAVKIDSSIADLSLRQFHARYPLQVKRIGIPQKEEKPNKVEKVDAEEPPTWRPPANGRRKKPKGLDPAKVRAILLELARDVAVADKDGLVQVIGNLDHYVQKLSK